MARARFLATGPLLIALAVSGPGRAQAPRPVDAAPVPPPPAATIQQAPPPAATIQQAPAPGGSVQTAPVSPPPALGSRPTLVPGPGDTSNVDEVVLPEKPVLILSGTSQWDDGLKNLRAAFGKIEAELAREGLQPAGQPIAVFVQTSDDNFRFDAMVPVGAIPTPTPSLPADMRFGTTPSGKAYRFVHKGPYDEIDSTYETITAYLDTKDVVAKDAFIEEYVNNVSDPSDPALEINIFVQPR